jgi:uncharacterized protein
LFCEIRSVAADSRKLYNFRAQESGRWSLVLIRPKGVNMLSLSTDVRSDFLIRSPHVRAAKTTAGTFLAYHSLFGNLSWMDYDVFDILTNPGYQRVRTEHLISLVGSDVAHNLVGSYFFVSSEHEERHIIAEWLRERADLAPTGYYITGLQISASNACNLACSYCFADASDKRSPFRVLDSNSSHISLGIAQEAITKVQCLAASHGRPSIGVKFLGREPLLNFPVIRALLRAPENAAVKWSITTNGLLLDHQVASEFANHNVNITISLDGPREYNDSIRVSKSANLKSFDAAERAMNTLHSARYPFAVSAVISALTPFDAMPDFVARLANLGARELELTLVMQTTNNRFQESAADPAFLIPKLTSLYNYARGLGLLVHGDWVDPFHRILTTHKRRDEAQIHRRIGAACAATSHQLSLEPSGDMFPCRAMSIHYGHMSDLTAVLQSPGYRSVAMRTLLNVPYCNGCGLEGFCQGTCLGASEQEQGDIYKPLNSYCDVYRLATQALLNQMRGPTMN